MSTSFRKLPFSVEILPLWLKHMYSNLSVLTWRPMLPAVHSRLRSRDLTWVSVFARSAISSVIFCAGYCLLLAFSNLSTTEICSLGRLWTGIVLIYPLSAHLWQCQRSLCLHPVSVLLLLCFYRASLWLQWSPWVDRKL